MDNNKDTHLSISMRLAGAKGDKETKIQVNKQYIIIKIKSDLSVGQLQHELFLANQMAYDAEIAILAGTIGFSWTLKPGISISV